jgi:hypothetical protein
MDMKADSKKATVKKATTPTNSADKAQSKEMKNKKATRKATITRTPLVSRAIKVLDKEPKFNEDSIRSKCFSFIRSGMTVEAFIKAAKSKRIAEPSAIVALKKLEFRKIIALN